MKGFTLIEIAIVIFVLGLTANQIIPIIKITQERKVRALTQKELNELSEAIYGFLIINYRLPCPDTNGDFQEDYNGSQCQSVKGNVPTVTLGTEQQTDYSGKPYQYEIVEKYGKSNSLKKIEQLPYHTEIESTFGLARLIGMNTQENIVSYYVLADRIKTRY